MDPREAKIFTAILIAAGVLGIILVYFLFTILKSQRRHLALEKASLLVEMTTLENERKRIVADLHDELGPLLAVVKFQVSSLNTIDPRDVTVIEKAGAHLDKILERIREICNHLMPQVLLRKGLVIAIEEFLADQGERANVEISYQFDEPDIPAQAEVHIYRLMQEIIHNSLKHAEAKKIDVILKQEGKNLLIKVSDDGHGFVMSEMLKSSTGHGLKNIIHRVDILGGQVFLESEPGKGTVYKIEIPNNFHDENTD
ncbi:MAG: ATP-binding protein [Flavitalea sp.]